MACPWRRQASRAVRAARRSPARAHRLQPLPRLQGVAPQVGTSKQTWPQYKCAYCTFQGNHKRFPIPIEARPLRSRTRMCCKWNAAQCSRLVARPKQSLALRTERPPVQRWPASTGEGQWRAETRNTEPGTQNSSCYKVTGHDPALGCYRSNQSAERQRMHGAARASFPAARHPGVQPAPVRSSPGRTPRLPHTPLKSATTARRTAAAPAHRPGSCRRSSSRAGTPPSTTGGGFPRRRCGAETAARRSGPAPCRGPRT